MTKIYVVKSGDYLSKIAHEQLGDGARWPEIAEVNALKYPYTINPNQILYLPSDNNPLTIVITKSQAEQAREQGALVPAKKPSIIPVMIMVALGLWLTS